MAAQRAAIAASPFYGAIAGLVLLAAFTKSAQVPFHFWLPNAMEAPTPVSAYLHSATMVKAGVYLVARMTPIVGSTPLWTTVVTAAGAATMVVGAYRAVQETDLKRILETHEIAEPIDAAPQLPPEPGPRGCRVSPRSTSTRSGPRPSISPAIWATIV